MNKYKVGIIGCGRMGFLFDEDEKTIKPSSHAGAYKSFKNCDMVAVCDIRTDRLDLFKKRYGNVNTYYDYNEMLEKEDLDIISICTPSNLHSDVCIKAANHVKAIFCEKPIAMSLKEADQMINACKKNNVLLAVDHIRRWDRTYEKIKELIDDKTYGEVTSIVAYSSPGLMNGGVHIIDVIQHVFGRIQCISGHIIKDASTDACGIGYLTVNGIPCLIDATPKKYMKVGLDIYTTEGVLENSGITRGEKSLIFRKGVNSSFESGVSELIEPFSIDMGVSSPPLINAIENIINTLGGKDTLKCSGDDGRKAIEVAIAFHLSSYLNGKQIDLPIDTELGIVPRQTSYNEEGRLDE